MSALDDLLNDIFDGNSPAFYPEVEGWVRQSRRYRQFVENYRSKIRAKLKNVRDESGMKALRAELETAAFLLRENRFTLEYERYAASRQRGPDFTVTFKTHITFNVEVRRLHNAELDDGDPEAHRNKLMAVLCDKVGQMPPSIVNLLWLVAESEISEADLTSAVTTLRELAERKAEDFFMRRGFKNAADFLKQYRQLSGIVVRQPGEQVLWLNPIARHKASPEIVKALQRLGGPPVIDGSMMK
jgi:hypothetical protein